VVAYSHPIALTTTQHSLLFGLGAQDGASGAG